MVCDNMSLGDHALYEVRAGLQVVPDNEKRGGNLMLFSGHPGSREVAVLVSGVEGQVDDLFAGKISGTRHCTALIHPPLRLPQAVSLLLEREPPVFRQRRPGLPE